MNVKNTLFAKHHPCSNISPEGRDLRMEDKEQFRKALEDLESSSLDRRVRAIELLGNMDTRESLHFLLRCLHDESWHLRKKAVKLLGNHGSKVIAHLKGVIQNGLWFARASSASVVGEIGVVEGIDRLVPLLEDESRIVREEAQGALTMIISKDPSSVFTGYLKSKDQIFVRRFLEKLKRIDPDSYELLFEILLSKKEENPL
jgi:HEAT repeat protein